MTNTCALATSTALVLGGIGSGLSESRSQARSYAMLGASLATAIAGLTFLVSWLAGDAIASRFELSPPEPRILLAVLANSLIALLCTALAPLASHTRSTFRTIAWLAAIGSAFLGSDQPLVLAVLWAASAGLTFFELLRSPGAREHAILFLVYQATSVLLFGAGAFLLERGQRSLGAALLLGAIAIRESAVPVHSWLPRFVETAPIGLVVAFVAPQLGVYAHLQLHHGLSSEFVQLVARIGSISALYAAFVGLGPRNVRRAAAYLAMSQTGLVAFGLENHSSVGFVGALTMWFVQALGVSAFLLTLGALEARRGTLELGGASAGDPHQVPRLAAATLLVGLATVGAPLTLGFVADDLLAQGSVSEHPVLGLMLVVTTTFNALTVLRLYFGLFTAGPHRPGERDLGGREIAVISLVLVVLVAFGVFPGPLVAFIH